MRLRPWPDGDCKPTVHGAIEGSWEQRVIDEIAPRPEDYLIPKFRWSAFHQTYLDLALRSRGIDTLIVSGGAVDVGIAATVYAARDHDYSVIVVRDACGNSYDDSMKAFMDTVFPRMARVRSTDQAIGMLERSGK
jgi:nicotinamidase-related amidase